MPKKGTDVPPCSAYAVAVSKALLAELGPRSGATKIVMHWTGASERSVKYWIEGTRGPDGRHLVMLMKNSDEVLRTVLSMAGREQLSLTLEMSAARDALSRAIHAIDELLNRS